MRAADDRTSVSVPDFGGSHRGRRRPRLSHFPGAALSLDGRDPALCRLDHSSRLSYRLSPGLDRPQGLSLGVCRGAAPMSALSFHNVWVEYGQQIVLERLNIDIAAGTFLSVVGPSGAGKSTFLRLILGQERPSQGAVLLNAKPFPAEPGPDRGIVFQRYSVFPHLTVLGNVLVGYEFEQRPLTARLFGAARRQA